MSVRSQTFDSRDPASSGDALGPLYALLKNQEPARDAPLHDALQAALSRWVRVVVAPSQEPTIPFLGPFYCLLRNLLFPS